MGKNQASASTIITILWFLTFQNIVQGIACDSSSNVRWEKIFKPQKIVHPPPPPLKKTMVGP